MECSRIPAADEWEQFSAQQQDLFREHLEYCSHCRRRFFHQSPEKLLFEISESPMPEGFWLGFWDSLYIKLFSKDRGRLGLPLLRWAAVFVAAFFLALYSHHLPTQSLEARRVPALPESFQYPLVEEVRNPKATYCIFQPSGNEKIVMIVDPDLEL
jgi:hypothetical protein